jgi:hypothetical protein
VTLLVLPPADFFFLFTKKMIVLNAPKPIAAASAGFGGIFANRCLSGTDLVKCKIGQLFASACARNPRSGLTTHGNPTIESKGISVLESE